MRRIDKIFQNMVGQMSGELTRAGMVLLNVRVEDIDLIINKNQDGHYEWFGLEAKDGSFQLTFSSDHIREYDLTIVETKERTMKKFRIDTIMGMLILRLEEGV